MTDQQTRAQKTAAQIADINRAEAEGLQRQNAAWNARVTGLYHEQLADFLIARRQAGDTIIEGWDELTEQDWKLSDSYTVHEYQGGFYWIGMPVGLGKASGSAVSVGDNYTLVGYYVAGRGAAYLYKIADVAVFRDRAIHEARVKSRLEQHQAQAAKDAAEMQAWLGAKHRDYAPTKLRTGTRYPPPSLSTIREKMAEFGIEAVRSPSGRVVVSRPLDHSGNTNHILSSMWFDLACQLAELLVDEKLRCDVPKCTRRGEHPTDSGAAVCPVHAGRS